MAKSLSSLIKEARRALDGADAEGALRHCLAALKTSNGASNMKLLLLTAQAYQALEQPRPDDAVKMLEKAVELDPSSINAWGLMRNILRQQQPLCERFTDLKRVYANLISLCANDSESQRRLRKELAEILETGDDRTSKLEALEIRMQALPLSEQDLVEIIQRQIGLKLDCFGTIRELANRRALPGSFLEDVISVIFAGAIASSSEEAWSERLSLLLDLSESHHSCKSLLQHLVSLSLLYRRIFNRDKPFFKRVCCHFLRLVPNNCFAWAALSCISVPLLADSDAPERLDEVRAAVRIGEIATEEVLFLDNEPISLCAIFAECQDTIINLKLELRPLDLVPIKTRMRSAVSLVNRILERCPDLRLWKDSMKASLQTSRILARPPVEAACGLQSLGHLLPRAKRGLINSLIDSEQFPAALQCIEQFWPQNPPVWALSALSWCQFKRCDDMQSAPCIEHAAQAVSHSPRCALYHNRLGRMYFAQSENPSLNKGRAFECFMTAARLDPLSSHPWTSLGCYYRNYKNDITRALKCFRKAISLDCTNSEAAIALCELLHPASDEVVNICKAAIDTNPFFCEWPWRFLLKARLLRQEWLDCVGAIQNLLKSSPKDIRLWMQFGFVYLRMGKFQSSARAFSQVVELDRNDVRAQYSLADIYLRMDQPVDAIAQLEHTLTLDTGALRPAVVELLRQTHYEYGKQLAQSGALDESKKQFEKAINLPVLASTQLNTWKLIGDIQIARFEPLLAAKAYAKAVFRSPSQPEAWYNLGLALYKSRLLTMASHCFKCALSLRPNYADAWISLTFTIPSSKLRLRLHCLTRAVEFSGYRSAPAWSAFALLALHYGDLSAAQKATVEAQRSDPMFDHLPTIQGIIVRASVALSKAR